MIFRLEIVIANNYNLKMIFRLEIEIANNYDLIS